MNKRLLRMITIIFILIISVMMVVQYSNSQESHEVIVILKNRFLTEYWHEVKYGIEKSSENHDVTVSFLAANSESDIEGQIDLIHDAIEMNPDAIMIASNDYTELVDAAKDITSNNIKLVIIDSGIAYDGYDSFVATDNYVGGYKAGEMMASKLNSGDHVSIMNYSVGSQTALERENGAKDALIESNKNIVVTTYFCYDDVDAAERITTQFIENNKEIKGIISLNETSSIGVARAIDELNLYLEVDVVAYDSSKEEIEYLEKGIIDALVVQKPFNMGYIGMETTIKILNNKPVEKMIDTGSKLIVKETMYDKENVDLLFPFVE